MLKNKKILVTGVSSGIGRECARLFLENGGILDVTYNTNKDFEDLAKSFPGQIDQRLQCDLLDPESLRHTKALLEERSYEGFLDATGINIPGPLLGLEEKDIRDQLEINLNASIQLTQSVLKNMVRARKGSIVHFSSVSAHRFARGHSVYSAAKAGLEGFCKALAAETAKRNIRVNTISPGPVMTDMLKSSVEQNGDDPKSRVPMNRLIEAREVAQAALFLLSDNSSAITGVNLPVDGGYTLW